MQKSQSSFSRFSRNQNLWMQINNQTNFTDHYLHEGRSKKAFKPFSTKAFKFKIFQNFLESRTIFPLNQFDGLYQQNRGKAPTKMFLFNLNYKSVTITIPLFTNSQIT